MQSQYQKFVLGFSKKKKKSHGNLGLNERLILKLILFGVEAETASPC